MAFEANGSRFESWRVRQIKPGCKVTRRAFFPSAKGSSGDLNSTHECPTGTAGPARPLRPKDGSQGAVGMGGEAVRVSRGVVGCRTLCGKGLAVPNVLYQLWRYPRGKIARPPVPMACPTTRLLCCGGVMAGVWVEMERGPRRPFSNGRIGFPWGLPLLNRFQRGTSIRWWSRSTSIAGSVNELTDGVPTTSKASVSTTRAKSGPIDSDR